MEIELGSQHIADLANRAVNQIVVNRGWGKDIAVDSVSFRYVGDGSYRVALEGPDGIVYKVPYLDPLDAHVEEEVSLFRHADKHEFSWVPDFCVYGHTVAMPLYEHYVWGPGPNWWRLQDAPVVAQIKSFVDRDVYPKNLGLRSDRTMVLIDGGCSQLQ